MLKPWIEDLTLKFTILQSFLWVKGELKERSDDSLYFVQLTPKLWKGVLAFSTKALSDLWTRYLTSFVFLGFLIDIIFLYC